MPRKKQEKLVEDEEEFEVDEPSEVEELENNATDDDWTPAEEEKKPGRPQRAARARKPVKLLDGKTTSDEDDEDEDEEEEELRGTKRKRGGNTAVRGGGGRGRGRGRPAVTQKKAKTDENGKGRGKKKSAAEEQPEGEAEEDEMEDVEDEEGLEDEEDSVSEEEESDDDSEAEDVEIPPEFRSGKFVLLKSDFDNKEENYPLWKIDGKSLLQKFDKFVHNGEELYKGTTIYAGWSKAVINTYYPITVEHRTVGAGGETTVKFDPSQITPEMQTAQKDASTASKSAPGTASGTDQEKPAEEEAEATAVAAEGDGEPEE